MIYLDYSATTPVSLEVQDTINKVTREFIGNANSINGLGIKSKNLLNSATKQIAEEFNILESEITYTASSTESNNIALIGVSLANFKRGKHIIVSKLEHPSIYNICSYLETIGFEISYVNSDKDGLIELSDKPNAGDTYYVKACVMGTKNYEAAYSDLLEVNPSTANKKTSPETTVILVSTIIAIISLIVICLAILGLITKFKK